MTHPPCEQPGILEVIQGRRVIQFCGDAYLAAATLRQYGEVITAPSNHGPHILRVAPSLDFASVVAAVTDQFTPAHPGERAHRR